MSKRGVSEHHFHIEFIKAWGHPTKNEVYGPPQRVLCSPFQAERLVHSGYAKLLPKEGRGDHFCPDWDDMLICREDPEWELCHCEIKKGIEDNEATRSKKQLKIQASAEICGKPTWGIGTPCYLPAGHKGSCECP